MAQSAPRSLYRLIYRSRQTPETAADLDFVVRQIMATAIRCNREVGISGLLLTVQGCFIQALEGNIDAVRTSYARISMDPRHSDQRIISQGSAERRLFGQWNMCASALAPSDKAILGVLDGKGDLALQNLTPANTLRLLTAVAEIQRRTALDALIV